MFHKTCRGQRRRPYGAALALLALLHIHELGYFRRAFEPDSEDDRAVILAAMENLASWRASALIRGSEGGPILLADHSSPPGETIPLFPFGVWPRLFQLNRSVQARNQKGSRLSWESNESLHLGTEEERWKIAWEHKPSLYRCIAYTSLPGYTRDGKFALLYAAVGPTAHGSQLTFLLRRSGSPGDPWEVLWRESIYYA